MTNAYERSQERKPDSLDNHIDELHQTILAAQRLIRAYDRAASGVINNWEKGDLAEAVRELQRVYERRQV